MARRSATNREGVKNREKEKMGDPTEVIARISEIEERIAKRMRGKGTLRRLGRFRGEEEGLRREEVETLPKAAKIASSLAESMKSVRALDNWGEKEA